MMIFWFIPYIVHASVVTQPTDLDTSQCVLGLPCILSFTLLPPNLNATNNAIYLSDTGTCDHTTFYVYPFLLNAETGAYLPSDPSFTTYPINSVESTFTVCWWSAVESSAPIHEVLPYNLSIYGPNKDQYLSCQLGDPCTVTIEGNLGNQSSIIVINEADTCGDASVALLELPDLLDQPFTGFKTFPLGRITRSPVSQQYRVCWSSLRRDATETDFSVDLGVLELSGPVRLADTASCLLSADTGCSITLSSPGYLRISENSECRGPAKLRFKLGSGENPVYSATDTYVFGKFRGAELHRDFALCWGHDGDKFPVFVGNLRFSLPECSSNLISAFAAEDAGLVESLIAVETDALCAISDSTTCLHAALAAGWLEVVDALVERGVNMDLTDQVGETAIFAGIANSAVSDDVLSAFITKTACDLRIPSGRTGLTPLHAAISGGRSDFVVSEMIPRLGRATLQVADPVYHGTPLLWAAQTRDTAALTALLTRGVDATVADFRGRTALHFAAMAGDVVAVQTLLRYCCPVAACVEARDERDLSVRDVAKDDQVRFWLDEYANDTQGCAKVGL